MLVFARDPYLLGHGKPHYLVQLLFFVCLTLKKKALQSFEML
jgi:hypothetical protein